MKKRAYYHLPGLFEFYELYRVFLPLFREHREYFYDWCEIGSIYGAPSDCIWGGGRTSFGEADAEKVLDLMQEYQISARLTFSNSFLREEHLQDRKCNELCALLEKNNKPQNGVIIHSDLLSYYLQKNYPGLYLVSSTTKVLTNFSDFLQEIDREEFRYVVPDFRLNKKFDQLNQMNTQQKEKVEFLCNGLDVRTEKPVTKQSVGKIWEKIVRNIFVQHLIPERDIFFQKQWQILDLLV